MGAKPNRARGHHVSELTGKGCAALAALSYLLRLLQFVVDTCFGKARARYLVQVSLDVRCLVSKPAPSPLGFYTHAEEFLFAAEATFRANEGDG